MKALAPLGACVLWLGLLLPAANADTITFTGTGSQSGISKSFDITGTDNFSLNNSTMEGMPIVAACMPGQPCEINPVYSAGMLDSLLISSVASLGNVTTSLVTGSLNFIGTITPPAGLGAFSATIPVGFSGEVTGHYNDTGRSTAFDVVLGGTGSADLTGEVVDSETAVVTGGRYSFSGTGMTSSQVPEPGAIYLTAGGIGLLALLFRRRRALLG